MLSETELFDFLVERDNVSDDELVARMNAAPDRGGALLVELHDFAARQHVRAGVSPAERINLA